MTFTQSADELLADMKRERERTDNAADALALGLASFVDRNQRFGSDPEAQYWRGRDEGFVLGMRIANEFAHLFSDPEKLARIYTELALQPLDIPRLTFLQVKTCIAAAIAAEHIARNGAPKIELVKESA